MLFFRGGFWWAPYRLTPTVSGASAPSVVAVIPARDEAAVIGRAVASLLAQEYPGSFHVLVVDDQSSDGTAEIARAAGSGAANRLPICRGQAVPLGWTGKLWAVHQGVELSRPLRPDYLLLTDADIVHGPRNLRELVSRGESESYDLVSLMVRLNCRGFWEKLLIPAFVFFFFKLYPPSWVADPGRRTAAAAGGCMLIRAATLHRIGGIGAPRAQM